MAKTLNDLVNKLEDLEHFDLEKALEKACLIVENSAKEKCPVDTGRLRNSITHEVDGEDGYVGTNVEYAPYVEFGTYKQQSQPFLQPALDENKQKIKKLFEDEVKEALRK